jgi:hypothetical protein
MKNIAAVVFTLAATTTAFAQPGPTLPPDPASPDCCEQTEQQALAQPARPETAAVQPSGFVPTTDTESKDSGWQRPPGQRFLHGIRIGWTYIMNFETRNRTNEDDDNPVMQSVKEKYGLKTPHMMLIGYEGMYRIVGHSWLNVVMVGNVTVAGLEQSKFIPAASGLIGAEFNESFQLGVGVNVTPDPDAPTHAIIAAGWTPKVGSIHTPIHFFFVPEPSTNGQKGNHRMGATVGVTW